ncbi:N-6 DNA methylase [Sphaerisporangium fuscum]|uniref:N-6 DNA methylase n=1 Tax=Sphaerisporangium fuscum TaxID=2835868 RepID=UPI001BDC38C4|nr:N-6 DNA methylase [Sphaerisporangium fuscum]
MSNWRRRYEDFPEPVGGTATSPTFSLKDVETWLLAQGKVEELPLRERVWQQIRMAADDLRLGDVVAEAAELLCGQGTSRLVPQPAWKLIRQLAEEEGTAEATRFLLDRFADVHSRRLAETPAEVAGFMARLAGPDARTVLDPACGLGTLPAAMAGVKHAYGQETDVQRAYRQEPGVEHADRQEADRQRAHEQEADVQRAHEQEADLQRAHGQKAGLERVYGQEGEGALARLARVRLALGGVDGEVEAGDSLRRDAWPGLAVDAVLCHPPFNERNWGYEELAGDPRWEYGLPPRSESELAWVQHALAHLRPGGVAVMLMPAIAAERRSGRRIRSNLLRRGAVQAVIGLPPKMAPGTGLPVHIWVLRRPDGRTPSRVLMCEAEPATFDAIVERWREFQADPDRDIDVPGESRTVPIIELIDENVDVTPARYVGVANEAAGDYVTFREGFPRRLEDLASLLPKVVPGQVREMPMVPLPELERTGALTVHQAGRYEADGSGALVLEAAHLFTGEPVPARIRPQDRIAAEPPTQTRSRDRIAAEPTARTQPREITFRPTTQTPPRDRIAAEPTARTQPREISYEPTPRTPPRDRIVVEPGDVVVGTRDREVAARVVEEGGLLLGSRLTLLRPDPGRLDPYFLAGFVRTLSVPTGGTQSGLTRFDVRRAQVPRLPLDEQRRYGEAFRKLFAFEAELHRLHSAGRAAVASVALGLTSGAFTPDE